ncbi:AMP-binding protein [Lonsdalea quercina]|uniref:AMP-binding protein n=1 Tax=Lonsdalea quercina TaxID=71657 RepID=UPI003975DF5D
MEGQSALLAIFARFSGCKLPAAMLGERRMTFDALYRSAMRLAVTLRAQGDAPVLIYGHKDFGYLTAMWACILAGRTFIPTEADNCDERIQQIQHSAQASLLLNTTQRANPATCRQLPVRDAGYLAAPPDLSRVVNTVEADQNMYILFSSGTTGHPKGIGVSYANVADLTRWLHHEFPLDGAVSGNIRYCFDVSLYELWLSWLFLKPLVILDHQHLFNTRLAIQRHAEAGTTCWVSTPSLTRCYLNDRQFNADALPALRQFIFCGEVLTKALVNALWQRFPGARITNTYGPTECTVAVTAIDIHPRHVEDERPLPLGGVRPGTRITLSPPGDAIGELIISGKAVGSGYLNATPEQQARFFVNDRGEKAYRTGDRGVIRDDIFYFQGRSDREIKLQGYRIDLNDIEQVLLSLPGVREAFVETWRRHGYLQGICAFVLSDEGDDTDFARLGNAMATRMPPWMIPRRWYAISEPCLNFNSKLDRHAVSAAAQSKGKYYVYIHDADDRPAAYQ